MKKNNPSSELQLNNASEQQLEILEAVAQAWHGQFSSSTPTNEYDAYPRNFQTKPSRFKLEAMNKSLTKSVPSGNWDFKQSLLDSYEIVTMAKKLERGLILDDPFSGLDEKSSKVHRRPKESKNSLRNLFNRMSSRRFSPVDVLREDT